MPKNSDAFKIGHDIMSQAFPGKADLANAYGIVAEFLYQNPDMQSSKNQETITPEFLAKHAQGFASGRHSNGPVMPKTIPDERIRDVLHAAYSVPSDKLDEAIRHHMEAMGAENFIGWILESYIAWQAEQTGWIWCSGAIIRAVDFIKPTRNGNWRMLQIKNRSNSENSSSSRVRLGTPIEKWFRVYANSGRTNWEAFPDDELRLRLSEKGFRDYIVKWIRKNFRQPK